MNALQSLLSLFLVAMLSPAGSVAQEPVASSCVLGTNNSSDTSSLGSATTDAACTVVWPTPSTPHCVISGTIDLYYIDVPSGYHLDAALWGSPNTNFTPIVNGHMTFTHPSGTTVACDGSSFSSHLFIHAVHDSNPALYVDLIVQRIWTCNGLD